LRLGIIIEYISISSSKGGSIFKSIVAECFSYGIGDDFAGHNYSFIIPFDQSKGFSRPFNILSMNQNIKNFWCFDFDIIFETVKSHLLKQLVAF
jgi:hypothetical protein